MSSASVSELKARLSSFLDRVKAGEEVIVTDRGHAIARVVPFAPTGPTPAEHEELVRRGLLRPARNPLPEDFWTRPRAQDPKARARTHLLKERETGW